MEALLVIDMQNAWLNAETPRFDRAGVIERINHAADWVRARGGNVVFIRHVAVESMPDTPGWQVDADLRIAGHDLLIDKTACDSFVDTTLLTQLQALGVAKLYMCGLATEFCVDTTVRSAVSRGFDVVVLADAHTTGDREHLRSHDIIRHHNWVWANMAVPAGRSLSVNTVAHIVN